MKLGDNEALRKEIEAVLFIGGGIETVTSRILDAVERHQPTAIPAVGEAWEGLLDDTDDAVGWEGLASAPPPPVSGSPQGGVCSSCAGTGLAPVAVNVGDRCVACKGTGRTPSSPPVDQEKP